MTRFYCFSTKFLNDEIEQKNPKNLESDINVAKMGTSMFCCNIQEIPWQRANSTVHRRNLHTAEYWGPWW